MPSSTEPGRRYTPDQVAEMYATRVETVRKWIRTRRLAAINIATEDRPVYRITPEALADFDRAGVSA